MGTTSVDPEVLRFAAQRLDEAADLLDTALRTHLTGLRLLSADSRARSSIAQLVDGVTRWQRESRMYADAIRACAERYLDEDVRGAQALR